MSYLTAQIETAQKLAEDLQKLSCERSSTTSCVAEQRSKGPRTPNSRHAGVKVRPFREYRWTEMCSTCAAYWHVSMAEIELREAAKRLAEEG